MKYTAEIRMAPLMALIASARNGDSHENPRHPTNAQTKNVNIGTPSQYD